MAKTMKAAVVHKFSSPLVIEGVLIPEPAFGEILVKRSAAVYATLIFMRRMAIGRRNPLRRSSPAHEVAGVVAALGAGVTRFKEGDSVGVAWLYDACTSCEYCETGWETLCESQHNTGYSRNGGFAEYVIAARHSPHGYRTAWITFRWRPFFARALPPIRD